MSLASKAGVEEKDRKPAMVLVSRPSEIDGLTQSPSGLMRGDNSAALAQFENEQELSSDWVNGHVTRPLDSLPNNGIPQTFPQENYISTAVPQEPDDKAHHSNQENQRRRGPLQNSEGREEERDRFLKLTPAQIYELTSSPESLPRVASSINGRVSVDLNGNTKDDSQQLEISQQPRHLSKAGGHASYFSDGIETPTRRRSHAWDIEERDAKTTANAERGPPDRKSSQTAPATPLIGRDSSKTTLAAQKAMQSSRRGSKSTPKPLNLDDRKPEPRDTVPEEPMPSPMPQTIPMPPFSLPTYLQLELSSHGPSPLYIHHSRTNDFPYESSKVKMERLQNFLRVPLQLEGVLWFGFFACLDAWLSCFTILPLRFIKAMGMVARSSTRNVVAEFKFIGLSLYSGPGRLWRRRRASSAASEAGPSFASTVSYTSKETPIHSPSPRSPQFSFPTESDNPLSDHTRTEASRARRKAKKSKHRRAKSTPSTLGPANKADIMKGFLILMSCFILMQFDASRMYHGIRGQAAIKLYVIYNVLEVCDRLLSALGQDVLECLFSKEALERNPDGRSKIIRPLRLFVLALVYNLLHSSALFFQVITLNVAVNSYSNALLTLLMSNQFVEIKSTVFKKFEKENLFQLTCADVVERFQLWLMLTIIALRNLIETGGLTLGSSTASDPTLPLKTNLYPKAFTIFPTWAGLLFQPFILVLGSEMLVDSLKHCYITKFNNTKPAIYGRFLDVLAKDYYTNAFVDQNLTRRLGLPIIPLSCLFIRALIQTYHMFLASHLPPPVASTATSLSVDSTTTSPATTAAIEHIDHILRHALGHSTFGSASSQPASLLHPSTWLHLTWSTDDVIALLAMLTFFLILFLCLLIIKLVLGMVLLSYARGRYKGMKEREAESVQAEGRRVGGWGVVEVDEDKRRWIYMDDKEGSKRAREREQRAREMQVKGGGDFAKVRRYSMVAKRIW